MLESTDTFWPPIAAGTALPIGYIPIQQQHKQQQHHRHRWESVGILGILLQLQFLLLVQAQLVASAAAVLVSDSFGAPGCPCRPHNPLHPQQAFCASDFVLKVKIRSYARFEEGQELYKATVKTAFKVPRKMQGTINSGYKISLWMASFAEPCGLVNVRQPKAGIISRRMWLQKSYLVTGLYDENGRAQLSICSWIAFWPTKQERQRLHPKVFEASLVGRQQSRYLRQGTYAKGCSICQIENELSRDSLISTKQPENVCILDSASDYNMCHVLYTFCTYHTNQYTDSSECGWHTKSVMAYRACVERNMELDARRLGINA